MAIKFGTTSLKRLGTVTPDLREVIEVMAELATPEQDFSVLEGLRSHEQAMINFGQGRTATECQAAGVPGRYAQPKMAKVTWVKNPFSTKHLAGQDGLSRAVDLLPYPFKSADWNDNARFQRMADLFFLALAKTNQLRKARGEKPIKARWGRDWDMDGKPMEKGETDGPHFELVD